VPPDLRIEGLPELHRALDGVRADLRDLSPVTATMAGTLVSSVRAFAPVRTGHLAASFEPEGQPDRASATSTLIYAGVQNYGGGNHVPGSHYADRALAAAGPRCTAQLDAGLAGACKKAER